MKKWLCAAFLAALSMFTVSPAAADQVSLSLSDGSFTVSGRLLEYDGKFYRIETEFGPLTLAADTTNCAGSACPVAADYAPLVKISGASSLGELLLPALIQNFASSRGFRLKAAAMPDQSIMIGVLTPGDGQLVMQFQLSLSSSAQGFAAMAQGQADLVMARRAPTALEQLALKATYRGQAKNPYRQRVIGWENLRVYNSGNNPIDVVTVEQLADLVAAGGRWDQVGGTSSAVELHGELDSVIALRQQLRLTGPTPRLAKEENKGSGALYVTPNLSLPHQHLSLSAACAPLKNPFGEELHPLTTPIYIVSPTEPQSPIVRDFLAHTVSLSAQRVVQRSGFISRTPTEQNIIGSQGFLANAILSADAETTLEDIQAAIAQLQGYKRLSLVFRYVEGTSELDEDSKSNLKFLAKLLAQGRFRNRNVIFAGFSDSQGSHLGNQRISAYRARTLMGGIRALMDDAAPAPERYRAIGLGETLPLACNNTTWGLHQNRRVEIWVR